MYREAVIKIYKRLQKELPNENVAILLSSYINMQRILYAPESKRTASSILRLCAQSFIHFSLLSRMKSLGNKCHLFGKYQHCLAAHATQMYRVTSGYSANTGWLNPKIPSSYVRNTKASLQNWKIWQKWQGLRNKVAMTLKFNIRCCFIDPKNWVLKFFSDKVMDIWNENLQTLQLSEDEERRFNALKRITNTTTNRKHRNILEAARLREAVSCTQPRKPSYNPTSKISIARLAPQPDANGMISRFNS